MSSVRRKTHLGLSILFSFAAFTTQLPAQELLGRQTISISSTFAPDSSHIFIGVAEQRRVWTAGLEYSRRLWGNGPLRLDYEGSVSPFFQERDPTIAATYFIAAGRPVVFPADGQRVTYVNNNPVGVAGGSVAPTPIYPIYGSTRTYAVAVSPIGARFNAFSSYRLQPTFSTDLGVVFSSRNIPIDDSASFNYLFSFGPGVQAILPGSATIRLEYLFRHMSNADSGNYNPGVDSGVIRLTLGHSTH